MYPPRIGRFEMSALARRRLAVPSREAACSTALRQVGRPRWVSCLVERKFNVRKSTMGYCVVHGDGRHVGIRRLFSFPEIISASLNDYDQWY